MSDFLISLEGRHGSSDLLDLVRKPYGARVRRGKHFTFPWGALAVLDDLNYADNVVERDGCVCCWVGDLVMPAFERSLITLIGAVRRLGEPGAGPPGDLTSGPCEVLNGAFAMVIADRQGLSIITSPLDFTPVFVGAGEGGEPVAFGTHPDVVAGLAGALDQVDPVSIGEFLNAGTPTFPHTLYQRVRQLRGGSVCCLEWQANRFAAVREHAYWSAPQEIRAGYSEKELGEELRHAFLSAVRNRCRGKKAAVLLSGGLDSRFIMASVPTEVECVGLTFCDRLNREACTARRVAQCYGRHWHPLVREEEYVGNNIVGTVRLIGGEYDWIHAHAAGFEEEINEGGFATVFDGTWMDGFLRAAVAYDWARVPRWAGALPAQYRREAHDYVNRITPFLLQHAPEPLRAQVRARRRAFFERMNQPDRGSPAEWLELHPATQRPEVSTWHFNRRVFPAKSVAMDRRLLDFACKCPIELRLGSRVFLRAAAGVYRSGARIPNANDGVRPGSSHWWRLAQRLVRKSQDTTARWRAQLTGETRIEHSWHDYQAYWAQSTKLGALIEEYGRNLEPFEGTVLTAQAAPLLRNQELSWTDGFRLLQLAIWRGLARDYRAPALGVGNRTRDEAVNVGRP
jgi:hypothetical protein